MIRATLRLADGACTAGAVVAAIAAALLACMLIAEVVLTSFFSTSQPWAVEFAIYLQACVLFCGSGWALRQGGHIRVSVLLQTLPTRLARVVDMIGTAFAIGVLGFLVHAMWMQWLRSAELGSISYYPMGTPVWVPQGVLTIGVTLLLVSFIARLVRLAIGEPAELATSFGAGGHE